MCCKIFDFFGQVLEFHNAHLFCNHTISAYFFMVRSRFGVGFATRHFNNHRFLRHVLLYNTYLFPVMKWYVDTLVSFAKFKCILYTLFLRHLNLIYVSMNWWIGKVWFLAYILNKTCFYLCRPSSMSRITFNVVIFWTFTDIK